MTPPLATLMPPAPDLSKPTLDMVKDAFLALCDWANTAYTMAIWTEKQFEGFLANLANAFYEADSLEGQAVVCQSYYISIQQRLIAAAGGVQ